jgi:hypothetical protein
MPARLERDTVRVNVRLFSDDYAFLVHLLGATGETPNSLMRRLIELYVEKARAAMLARAGASPTPDTDPEELVPTEGT